VHKRCGGWNLSGEKALDVFFRVPFEYYNNPGDKMPRQKKKKMTKKKVLDLYSCNCSYFFSLPSSSSSCTSQKFRINMFLSPCGGWI
jgi:hypothetical protein